ncbi:hypothetical protein AUC61_14725 [Pseudomonas sp. S25]|uniref:Spore coat protein U (SCPU) domain-containing protein n=1 Tax=Pseudomonas maioricensis TaxID=1766623 RepID=A0ABS9ZJN0_9PSED|nr:hypothetical protein [Pseudomonas sp. S25]MCI8210789.1 hypothetical protein [Pseudomonas sp. S25]
MALIEVINDANTVLIDDNYSNMCLASSGILTLYYNSPGSGGNSDMNFISYTGGANEFPQLVLELSGSVAVAQVFNTRSGNTWIWSIAFLSAYYGYQVNYYVLSVPSSVADAGGMLQLRDGNEKLVFDSNLKYMAVKGLCSPSQNSNINLNMAPERRYGVLASSTGWTRMFQRANPLEPAAPYTYLTQNASLLHYRSGTNIVSSNGIHQQGTVKVDNPGNLGSRAGTARLIILDITNF